MKAKILERKQGVRHDFMFSDLVCRSQDFGRGKRRASRTYRVDSHRKREKANRTN
jgi:hypothetical protein